MCCVLRHCIRRAYLEPGGDALLFVERVPVADSGLWTRIALPASIPSKELMRLQLIEGMYDSAFSLLSSLQVVPSSNLNLRLQ